ncbi:MAG: 4Fe-4S binding protein [Candidatus Altiarchaeota archaeon]|nr:4Fe-4S binding protein [Candidatus Altiarchaeota archaeon]
MKQLTVISGKGGTGKTSLVGAFAALAKDKVLADCDVDASDLHLLLHPEILEEKDFKALKTAEINQSKCIGCGKCEDNCVFDAINEYVVDSISCEGCGVCEYVCPADAISLKDKVAGKTYISKTRFGPLCHARLNPGEEASGKLVTEVRNNAQKLAEEEGWGLIIIDGSPGIGCPVIASIGGVDLVLAVTEPTMSGLHDLVRILAVADHFNVPSKVCINKCDINHSKSLEIEKFCLDEGVEVVGKIPYDLSFTKAQIQGKTIIEYENASVSKEIKQVWDAVNRFLEYG